MKNLIGNKKALVIAGVIAAMTAASAGLAEPISGSISMQGLANLATSDGSAATIGTATEVQFVPGYVYVGADNGAFATVPLDQPGAVTMTTTPWVFNPSTAMSGLWTVASVDGFTFTFDAASESFTQSGDFLNIIGAGTISSSDTTDYSLTPFDWSITFDTPPSGGPVEYNFSAYTESVPDGGLTVALLGLSLAIVECFRRKLAKI